MSEQHRSDARSIIVKHGVGFQKSTLFGKSLQVVRTTSSISKYSSVLFEREEDFSKDRLDAQSSRPDVNLIKIELRSF
jgi:hypothetical protein